MRREPFWTTIGSVVAKQSPKGVTLKVPLAFIPWTEYECSLPSPHHTASAESALTVRVKRVTGAALMSMPFQTSYLQHFE